MKINRITSLIIFFLVTTTALGQGKRKKEKMLNLKWNYEVECVAVGNQGEYLVKVFSFYKSKRKEDLEVSKKNALHAVIFKGVPADDSRRCVAQPPLVKNANVEEQKSEYFDDFFKIGGKYKKFVNLTAGGAVDAGDRYKVRIGKKKYTKVGVVVSINKDLLRTELESAGIIRKLSSGF